MQYRKHKENTSLGWRFSAVNEVAFGTNARMKYLREKFSCNLIRDIVISITPLLLYSISPIWEIFLRHSLFHSYAAFLTCRLIIPN